jgi:TP901 family phage tail tape measure protein
MAKTITDEQMKLSIIINGDSAQKELFDLEKSTRALTETNKGLLEQKKLLEKQGKKDTAEYRLLSSAIKDNTAEIKENKDKMAELQKQIGLTGMTMAQLQSKATMLRNTLRNLVPGSDDYIRYQAELEQVNNRLGELRGNSSTARMSIGSLADSFNRYQGIVLSAVAAMTGVVLSIQKIIDINGKLSDAQSDVMKTTGMTKIEVDELTKSFGMLETRTSRIDLLGIAEQGGRIGIAKNEIQDFVKSMNMAAVSLGDSFSGGAEEVSEKLGKIKFLFQETKGLGVEQAYNSIGSAINDLGANGTASEANIAEFTTRIGSLTDVLKPTIQETLAMGTAFEESGIEAEVSSRAYSIFMNRATTESGKFAEVMGISRQEVEKMLNTNPLEFMLKFSQGMKGMDATKTAQTLDYLGISADGANKVIGAMGNNTARFRELMELSNKSFADGTSLINEYDVKNNNLAATYEKISKKISGWFSSEGFNNFLISIFTGFAKLIGAVDDTDGSMTKWKNTLLFAGKMVLILTSALITNAGWQKLVAMWTTRNTEATLLYNIAAKARAFADGVAMVASQAYSAVTMLLRGNIVGATQAFRVMTTAMMTTPWGFIIGAVAAIGTAYVMFSKSADEASASQKMLAEVTTEANKSIASEKAELEALVKIANNEKLAKEDRLNAIQKLNDIIPDYIGVLNLENIKTAEGVSILKKYTAELYANARAKAVQAKFEDLAKQRVEVENKKTSDISTTGKSIGKFLGQDEGPVFQSRKDVEKYVKDTFKNIDKNMYNTLVQKYVQSSGLNIKEAELSQLDAQMKALEPEILQNKIKDLKDGKNDGDTGGSNFKAPGGKDGTGGKGAGTKKDPNSSAAEINRLKLEDEAKYNDAYLKLVRQREDDKIAAMADGYEKDMLLENQRYQRRIDDLNSQKVHTTELAKLDEDIAKAKEAKDTTKYNALLVIKKGWAEKNKAIDAKVNEIIEGEMSIHNAKLGIIQEKGAKQAITKAKEAFDDAKLQRETKFNEELAALGNNKKAKEKLTREYQLNEIAEEEKFLKELVAKFNTIVGGGKFEQMDMSLLTPEQAKYFTEEAAKMGLSLSQLIQKKNELSGGGQTNGEALGISKGTTDIFGFTPENWLQFHENIKAGKLGIDEVVFAMSAMTDMYSKYDQFVTANENRQLKTFQSASDAKKTKLKKQLDSGVISQKQYDKQVAKIDKDLEDKKFELELKQAKRQKAISAMNIIMSTAQAIIGIWAQFPKADFGITAGIMSGVVGAMGAMQLATVLAQPLPAKGYEEGLYPEYVKRQQDGKMFKSKFAGKTRSGLVSETSHFLVAENGPEMVIDNKAWTQLNPRLKEDLVRNLQGIKGFENGLYNQQSQRIEVPATTATPSSNDALLQMMYGIVAENTAVLKDLRDNGVIAMVSNRDLKSMKNLKEGINEYETLRNKSKK